MRSLNCVTGSILTKWRVFGRDQVYDDIVGRLIGDDEEIYLPVAPVVAVIGYGGMGKTMLAQRAGVDLGGGLGGPGPL